MIDKFDKYEQDIPDSFERGEWQSVENLHDEIKRYRKYAHATINKDQSVQKTCKES
jgi:hypothetical protein